MRWPFRRPPADPVVSRHVPRPRGMSDAEFEAYQLYVLAQAGVEHVRVQAELTAETPPPCRAGHGDAMTVEAAMRQPPIPHAVGPGQTCRCVYGPSSWPASPYP